MKTENFEKVIAFLNSQNIDIDFRYHLQSEDIESAEDIRQILEDANAFDIEIIYYSRAIEYLKNNDPSLNESLQLANDLGYAPANLNSEILASLLASQEVREEFSNIEDELQDLITEILEEEANEEEEEEKTN